MKVKMDISNKDNIVVKAYQKWFLKKSNIHLRDTANLLDCIKSPYADPWEWSFITFERADKAFIKVYVEWDFIEHNRKSLPPAILVSWVIHNTDSGAVEKFLHKLYTKLYKNKRYREAAEVCIND